MSWREKHLWAETLISVLVSVYFFSHSFTLLLSLEDDSPFPVRDMTRLIITTVILSIILSVVIFTLLRMLSGNHQGEIEPSDERDRLFELRSNQVAYWTLCAITATVVGAIVLNSTSAQSDSLQISLPMSPLLIAQALIAALTLSSLAKSISALFYYRRGY